MQPKTPAGTGAEYLGQRRTHNMNNTPNPSAVNRLVNRFQLMQADQFCRWLRDHAGQYSKDEKTALEIYVESLTPWMDRKAV